MHALLRLVCLLQVVFLPVVLGDADCVDALTYEKCRSYKRNEICTFDVYRDWAMKNCKLYCGFCVGPSTPPTPCIDAKDHCELYGADLCTNDNYKIFAEDNCAKTCRICTPIVG